MKRSLSIVLAALLLMTLVPMAGLAAGDSLKIEMPKELWITPVDPYPAALTITNQSPHDVTFTVKVYDEQIKGIVAAMQYTVLQGEAPLMVNTQVYKALPTEREINTYRYIVESTGGFKEILYFAQEMYIDRTNNDIRYAQWENTRFPRNTVSSFGPQFRVLNPQLTKDWYMVTPINLSIQGRQSFELVASNMYNIGQVHVNVYGDTVNVTYEYHFADNPDSKIKPIEDYLTFFGSFDQVKSTKPEENRSNFAFGKPFSIANELGGDTNVLMFVRNRVTYNRFPVPKDELKRNYPNSEANAALRQQMINMMDPVPGLTFVNDHNYGSK